MSKNILILGILDDFANSSKPTFIEATLKARGNKVTLINTRYSNRYSDRGWKRSLPGLHPVKLCSYCVEAVSHLKNYVPFTKFLQYPLTVLQMRLRAELNKKLVRECDVLICETQIDSMIFLKDLGKVTTIYDCATPFADEMNYGNKLTKRQYEKAKILEIQIFESVKHLSFHWRSYADYVKKYYKDTGNIFTYDWGVQTKTSLAKYRPNPRIVYLGNLHGYWINLPLLSSLSKSYNIDVYGSPRPNIKYGLNYKGYANANVLTDYQFGIITITKDRLRSEGFSAKHLEYLSYGLPTLMPDWRTSARGMKGTIFYNESNFVEIIHKYSQKDQWDALSKDAIAEANKYKPELTIRPLIRIIEKEE